MGLFASRYFINFFFLQQMLSPRICASLRQGIEEEESQQNRQYQYDLEDERTLLDVFGDSVKDVLSHHVVRFIFSVCI